MKIVRGVRTAVSISLLMASASGCGMFKRAGAVDPASLSLVARKFTAELAAQTNLSRSSGPVLFLRLQALFPKADPNTLNPTSFSPGASSLDRTLGSPERSFSPVAQMALRTKAADLCTTVDLTGTIAGSVFSTQNILVDGESLPQNADPLKAKALVLGLAVARNVWLDLYAADSPEVQALSKLYLDQIAQGASDRDASKNVCLAALAAPQFWIGNATDGDALRRAALEIGRRLPKMSELHAYVTGKLQLRDYIKNLQTDPASQHGYLSAIHDWHRDWLGLRPIFAYGTITGDAVRSAGGDTGQSRGFSWLGGYSLRLAPVTSAFPSGKLPNLNPPGQAVSSYIVGWLDRCGDAACISNSQVFNTAHALQYFDPRTTVLLWQHKNPALNGALETVGAWVQNQPEAIKYYMTTSGQNDLSLCTLTDSMTLEDYAVRQGLTLSKDPVMNADYFAIDNPSGWYKCDGIITGYNGAKTVRTYMDDLVAAGASTDKQYGTQLVYPSSRLTGTPIKAFLKTDRKIRRFSPSGEQDGFSLISLWYSGEKVWVSNTLDRYRAGCFYRPVAPAPGHFAPRNFSNAAEGWNAAVAYPADAYGQTPDTIAHPRLLNDYFHCGKPIYSEIIKGDPTNEEKAYPHGGPVNDIANMASLAPNVYGWGDPNSHGPEWSATEKLLEDISDEPLHLVDYILTNNRSYKELITANYTLGREELELMHRTSALYMPVYPPGYSPSDAPLPGPFVIGSGGNMEFSHFTFPAPAFTQMNPGRSGSVNRLDYRLIDSSIVQDLPTNLIKASSPMAGWWLGSTNSNAHVLDTIYMAEPFKPANTDVIPAQVYSGILTMPAFRSPVAQGPSNPLGKMRTLSDRYFLRLMCGQPNLYTPDSAAESLHEKYVPMENAEVAKHLDKTKGCFACHINMDPLAEALSPGFASNVQSGNPYLEGQGEMISVVGYQWGKKKGTGAVLGKKVSGVREVGQVIAESKEFAGCVVQKTFENVFGRQMRFEDAQFMLDETKQFMTHYNYNQLVQELVDSAAYKRKD